MSLSEIVCYFSVVLFCIGARQVLVPTLFIIYIQISITVVLFTQLNDLISLVLASYTAVFVSKIIVQFRVCSLGVIILIH